MTKYGYAASRFAAMEAVLEAQECEVWLQRIARCHGDPVKAKADAIARVEASPYKRSVAAELRATYNAMFSGTHQS